MKNLTLNILALSILAIAPAFASQEAELAQVRRLADRKITGSDVRKQISLYDNKESNPCAEEGVSYIVKVEVRKSVMQQLPSGEVGQKRKWQELNQYYISRRDLLDGKDLSDSLCLE